MLGSEGPPSPPPCADDALPKHHLVHRLYADSTVDDARSVPVGTLLRLWRNNTGRCGCERLEPIIVSFHIMLKECCFCGGVVCTCIWAQAGGRGGGSASEEICRNLHLHGVGGLGVTRGRKWVEYDFFCS